MLKEQIKYLQDMTDELKSNNSSNEKKIILKRWYEKDKPLFKKWMDYVYSYDKKYWMTSANIEKMAGKFEEKYDFNNKNDVFTDILDKLIKRKITGHNALNFVQDLIKFVGKEYQHTIFGIVNKDLKSQVSTSLINKVVPGTVKEFNVALAEKFKDTIGSKSHEVDFTKRKYQVSKKLDGLRTLSMNNSGKIEVFSRQGNEFLTLDNLKNDVNQLLEIAKKEFGKEFVLDGECCILNADGKEDFSLIMKEATRKNHTIKNPTIIAFDLIERKEFDALIGETPFSKRIERLEKLMSKHKFEHIKLVDHQNNITEEHFNQWRDKVKENDWEGVMLRAMDSYYEGKRNFDLIKVKDFADAEYKVVDVETGTKKMLVNGIMKETPCVTALIIEHKGSKVGVGSGLSDDQRVEWFKKPDKIIGSEITVNYFEETIDSKTGLPSLRFPTLKTVYDKKLGRQI